MNAPPDIDPLELEDARRQIEQFDVGPIPKSDQERHLYRYLRRRAELEGARAHVEAGTRAMLAGLESQLRTLDYLFRAEAERITRELVGLSGKKSIQTPFGKAGFRLHPERLVVKDEAMVMAAVDRDELPETIKQVQVTVSIRKSELNALYKLHGEVPPGCDVEPARDVFYTKAGA